MKAATTIERISISAFNAGNAQEYEKIYAKYYHPILASIEKTVTNHKQAATMADEVFFLLESRPKSFRSETGLHKWLAAAAGNKCLIYEAHKKTIP